MEEIIREIVDADKQARNLVSAKQKERHNIQNLIQDQSKEIKRKYQEETRKCIEKKRAELDEELAMQLKQEEKLYEDALQSLQQKYEDNREQWVKEIVDRCLAS